MTETQHWAAPLMSRLAKSEIDDEDLTCSRKSLVLFTNQFSVLIDSGITVTKALHVLSQQFEDDRALRQALEGVVAKVGSGFYLSKALASYPLIFDRAYVSMVRVGESGGGLTLAFRKLAAWLERDFKTSQKIRSALTYPLFVIGLGSFLAFILFYWVLPALMKVIASFQVPLPWITRCLMFLTAAVSNPLAWLIVAAGLGEIYLTLKHYSQDLEGRLKLYRALDALPGIGPLIQSAALSRLCTCFCALIYAGVPQPKAWHLSASVSGSPILERDIDRIMEGYKEGDSLGESLQDRADLYPGVLVQMVHAGEESGRLSATLAQAGMLFEQEMDHRIDIFSALLEPFLLGSVSLGVSGIIFAICLPLYGLLAQFTQ